MPGMSDKININMGKPKPTGQFPCFIYIDL